MCNYTFIYLFHLKLRKYIINKLKLAFLQCIFSQEQKIGRKKVKKKFVRSTPLRTGDVIS